MKSVRSVIALAAVWALATLPYGLPAQPDAPASDAGKPAAAERRAPLPNYFGKIAVNDMQRVQLYQIQDEYETQIDALQQQIRQLLNERDEKMESVLTPGQKLRLKELKEEARARAAQRNPANSAQPPAKD